MYSDYYELEKKIDLRIKVKDYTGALGAVKDFVVSVMHNQHSPGEIIGSAKVDKLCAMIGESYVKDTLLGEVIENEFYPDNNILILCTGIYKYGGTSLFIGDIIKSHEGFKSTIIATDYLNDMTLGPEELSRLGGANAEIMVAPKGDGVQKLYWLISQIIQIKPCRVFLLNHHQDSLIISAVRPFSEKTKVIFYHHADHNFCLGVHLEGAIHIDIHNVGYFNCRENEKITDNHYLPLTIPDLNITRIGSSFVRAGHLITCSSATYHKFKNFYLYPYQELIAERLLLRGGCHIHIGNIPEDDLINLRRVLRKKGVDQNRFVHIPWVDSLWAALLEYHVDLFINSFPIGGARTLIEVMGAGIPILMHENYLSRFHSSRDVGYPEALIWKYPECFENIISNIGEKELKEQSRLSRQYYVSHYRAESIVPADRLHDILSGMANLQPPQLHDYGPDYLDRALHFSHLEHMFRNSIAESVSYRYQNSRSWRLTKIFRGIRRLMTRIGI